MDLSNLNQMQKTLEQNAANTYGSGRQGFAKFRSDVRKYGFAAVVGALAVSNANAAVDVAATVTQLTTDGTSAITAVGTALLALAGIAVVFKWVKAAFFS